MFTDLWNWFNTVASTPAGATGLISAAVALTGSLMTFFRVFLERRSGKLVARDTKRREFRQKLLQPMIDDADMLLNELQSLYKDASVFNMSTTVQESLEMAARVERIRNLDRVLFSSELIYRRHFALHSSVLEVRNVVAQMFPLSKDIPSRNKIRDLLSRNQERYFEAFTRLHEVIDDVLFGGDGVLPQWLHRRLRRRFRRFHYMTGGHFG